MPPLDTDAENALDEAVGLCLDPVGRHAGLVRWLVDHPNLAGALAEDLAACADVDRWMSPVRSESLSADHHHQTVTFGGAPGAAGGDSVSLEFGDFECLEELGRGGMGVVFRARHRVLKKEVALKTVLAGGFLSPRGVARLRFEAEAAARLDHPNIVPIYGAGEHDGMPFFSMKLVSGGTLAERLDELRRNPKAAAVLLAKVARAVHYAHQRGIVHRDLKPGNILMERDEPLVADFGLAKMTDATGATTASGRVAGTPVYMAPEQAKGERSVTTASDVYSLGAILYQLLTGRPPFRGETVYEVLKQVIEDAPVNPIVLNPNAPADLVAVCLKCLEKMPENRYQSAAELVVDLEAFAAGKPVSARPRSVLSQTWRAFRGTREVGKLSESWITFTFMTLALLCACHGTIFALVATESRMVWVWVALVPYFACALVTRVRMLLRSSSFVNWERFGIVLFTGQIVCTIGLAVAVLPLDPDAPASAVLAWYPPLAILYAMMFFTQGYVQLGVYYPVSFAFLGLAVLLRYSGPAAPLVLLAVYAPILVFLAFAAVRAAEKSPTSEANLPS